MVWVVVMLSSFCPILVHLRELAGRTSPTVAAWKDTIEERRQVRWCGENKFVLIRTTGPSGRKKDPVRAVGLTLFYERSVLQHCLRKQPEGFRHSSSHLKKTKVKYNRYGAMFSH
jgi:hypothetical protein